MIGSTKANAAGLATGSGVNLRLDHPVRAAQLCGGVDRLIRAERYCAGRHRNAMARQNFLGLILVDVHRSPLKDCRRRYPPIFSFTV